MSISRCKRMNIPVTDVTGLDLFPETIRSTSRGRANQRQVGCFLPHLSQIFTTQKEVMLL